jgi:hypothetical protein
MVVAYFNTVSVFNWREVLKKQRSSVRRASVSREIPTEHLRNTSLHQPAPYFHPYKTEYLRSPYEMINHVLA